VIRIPKDEEDALKFKIYEPFNASTYTWVSKEELESMGIQNSQNSFLFEEAGVCDAPELCTAILKKVKFEQFDVKQLEHNGTNWTLLNTQGSTLNAQNIILSTGYQNELFDMRYMAVKGTWGSRGDYYSALTLDVSMHKSISISANIEGIIKVGATHVKSKEPCMTCDGEPLKGLFETASQMVDTGDFVLKETFCGMRAGSKDYFPLAGRVIDVPYMLEHYPKITRGAKPELKYLDNLYICNGVGGRGFVFSPLMAEWLAESIITGNKIDARVDPDRLFLKWCRKLR
jgi:tRNA 5-methylaminomethyl-2-thiouridine biosynthesis bifunctional protein